MSQEELNELQEAALIYWRRYRMFFYGVLLLIIVGSAVLTMFYQVEPSSRGVVLRMGEYLETSQPGLHWKLPWPIDAVYVVPVEKVQAVEFGYSTDAPGRVTIYKPTTDADKTMARMLTGDLNLAHVEWVVQYQIKDANNYLFKVGGERGSDSATNARDLIRDVSEAVMRRIIGDVSVDYVITTGRSEIGNTARTEMQEMLDDFDSGIHVVAVKLQSATPPESVKDAFDAVNRAKQSKERIVNDAKGQRNKVIPAARGKRDRKIAEAEGYEIRVTKRAEGKANAFLQQLEAYEKAPDITRVRLYLEAMEEILKNVEQKIVIDESVQGMLPLLHLDSSEGDTPRSNIISRGGAQ